MKKKVPREGERGKRSGDVRENFSPEQLKGIGEVAIAYNEAELLIDLTLGFGLTILHNHVFEVSTRISGVDGRIAIIKQLATTTREISKDTQKLIEDSFAFFTECKGYRDAVIHARILDAPSGLGELFRYQGQRLHVLLTTKALAALYDRLVAARNELLEVMLIYHAAFLPRLAEGEVGVVKKT